MQDVEDTVEHLPVVNPLGTATALGHERVDHRSFLVSQIKEDKQAPFRELESRKSASLKSLNWVQSLIYK